MPLTNKRSIVEKHLLLQRHREEKVVLIGEMEATLRHSQAHFQLIEHKLIELLECLSSPDSIDNIKYIKGKIALLHREKIYSKIKARDHVLLFEKATNQSFSVQDEENIEITDHFMNENNSDDDFSDIDLDEADIEPADLQNDPWLNALL